MVKWDSNRIRIEWLSQLLKSSLITKRISSTRSITRSIYQRISRPWDTPNIAALLCLNKYSLTILFINLVWVWISNKKILRNTKERLRSKLIIFPKGRNSMGCWWPRLWSFQKIWGTWPRLGRIKYFMMSSFSPVLNTIFQRSIIWWFCSV